MYFRLFLYVKPLACSQNTGNTNQMFMDKHVLFQACERYNFAHRYCSSAIINIQLFLVVLALGKLCEICQYLYGIKQ